MESQIRGTSVVVSRIISAGTLALALQNQRRPTISGLLSSVLVVDGKVFLNVRLAVIIFAVEVR